MRGEPTFPPASPVTFTGEAITANDWRTEMLSRWKMPPPAGAAEATADGVKLVTTQQAEHIYTLQAQILNQVPLKKGDTLLLRFAARSLLPGKNTGNHLVYGRTGKRANTQDGSTRVFWANNLFFNADDVLLNDSTIVGRDSLFVAALTARPDGFRLRPGSPALGKGLAVIAPQDDLSGTRRPAKGPVDIGAYQRSKG